ncbi:MAG: hypothetical protein OXG74_19695 [Acidobacteria bacterium]|nr:hypothetical protein [Acidobacteriota bacterium]
MPLSTKIVRVVLGVMMLGMVTVFLAITEGVWSFDALFGWNLLVVPGVVMSWFVTAPVFLRSKSGEEGDLLE